MKRRFGIVEIDKEQYVVIDASSNELILQKCVIDENRLKIDTNTYLHMSNEVMIYFETFEKVELSTD